jgi:trk system potassium uptake protein TrkA
MTARTARFLVIGLGQFGSSLARRLAALGYEVLAIDRSQERIEAMAEDVGEAMVLDTTDERALADLGIEHFQATVVAIGDEYVENSIMTTALVRQFGAPRIIARSTSKLHGRILRAVGAHEVINPEERTAELVADRLATPGIRQSFSLGRGLSVVEMKAPAQWIGQTLAGLDLRQRYGIIVGALRRTQPDGQQLWQPAPPPSEPFQEADVVLVIGADESLRRLSGGGK